MATAPGTPRRTTGFILWFTGLPSSGKTSLAWALAATLAADTRVEVLDGDELRRTLSRDLGYTREDRLVQAERVGFVARLLARHGVSVIVATISPYREARTRERERAEAEGVPFLEVFLDASAAALEHRDVKGLYRRARTDATLALTGLSAPYEPPLAPDLHLRTDEESIDVSRGRVLTALGERDLWPPRTPGVGAL